MFAKSTRSVGLIHSKVDRLEHSSTFANLNLRLFIFTNFFQKSSTVFGQNSLQIGESFSETISGENAFFQLKIRQFCSDPDYKYKEDGDLCNRNLWYKSKNLSTPNLDGPNYHRCGPDFENAVCSVNSVSTRCPQNPNLTSF